MIRVLHALDVFLPVSQNWIYPQISRVPGVESAVLCSQRINSDLYDMEAARVFYSAIPWTESFGFPRLVNSIALRARLQPLMLPRGVCKWKPSLIHAHFGTKGWDMLPLKRRLGVPLVTSFYGTDAWALPESSQQWRKRLSELFTRGNAFLVEGPAMRSRLVDIGCPRAKIQLIRLGIDACDIQFVERDFTRSLQVLMMARFVEKKGFEDGLEACARARGAGADLNVTIVGDAVEGDPVGHQIKSRLHALAAGPELRDRVKFEGFVKPERAREVMRECNVFLCPSKHGANGDGEGGSPVALTEAMAAGLLCIGARHCDIPEVIIDGVTGYLCDSGDSEGLASLLSMVAKAPSEARALAQRGRQHIESRFSTLAETVELESIYVNLTNSNPSAQR
jgi:colanic acid/amylovoran biosynthesis glycosyltransferase